MYHPQKALFILILTVYLYYIGQFTSVRVRHSGDHLSLLCFCCVLWISKVIYIHLFIYIYVKLELEKIRPKNCN